MARRQVATDRSPEGEGLPLTGPDAEFLSRSPFGDEYEFSRDLRSERTRLDSFAASAQAEKIVVIQGLGFVGCAMLTAVSSSRRETGEPRYAVVGIDLPTPQSYWKVARLNAGRLPILSSDEELERVFRASYDRGIITATTDSCAYELADIVVVDINLDVRKPDAGNAHNRDVVLEPFVSGIREIARRMKPSCLVVVETTVPPGTCDKVVVPLIREEFGARGITQTELKLAHSYERVMPGKHYLRSITHFYRVYSGTSEASRREVREFLESFIDTAQYPLTELPTTTASEMGKVLENTFRAANIAFIQEWTEFAEKAGVNLFEVIKAIRMRDTHRNIMLPGFGVGGYCLTKDPLLADWACTDVFHTDHRLTMSLAAVDINDLMPQHSLRLLEQGLGQLSGRSVLLMGVSYLHDVADTRNSPSETFYRACTESGATVAVHDPLVRYWPELDIPVAADTEDLAGRAWDAVVLAVRHETYLAMGPDELQSLLAPGGIALDCCNIVDDAKAVVLRERGFRPIGVGKGHWNALAGLT
jgi:UDP-N-acetyl-D-glucosamine dehydrogenase